MMFTNSETLRVAMTLAWWGSRAAPAEVQRGLAPSCPPGTPEEGGFLGCPATGLSRDPR